MTDRELLELAAKAAGLTINYKRQAERDAIGAGDAGLWIVNHSTCWNPLTDDGDALRLAVKLRLNILPDGPGIERQTVEVSGNTGAEVEPWAWETLDGGDPYAATRRAIVRAAAEIGRAPSITRSRRTRTSAECAGCRGGPPRSRC